MTRARAIWPALAVLAACIPFAGGVSLTNIFYIRDLSMFFWPRHLWIHRTLLSGSWPLWDPYAAAGQAAFPDALNQLFLPPAILLRLLPAIPGFNLLVLLPFPLAAAGTWLFLRRHVSDTSAALGAIIFSASGPVVATGNFPNLSWSVAWIPWILWAVDRDRGDAARAAQPRRSLRTFAVLAAFIALQMLSGEPVTMAGTMALLVGYIFICSEEPASARVRAGAAARVIAAIAVAGAIAAIQMVPMAVAASASQRGLMPADNQWSVHPLWLVESFLPHVFGDTFRQYNTELPFITPLNSGRDPFFYSLYAGTVALLLSVLGILSGPRRWRFFWIAAVVAGVVFAFGSYSPVYPFVQTIVPLLRSFRYPAKFLVFTSFGIAALAAGAANALEQLTAARGRTDDQAADRTDGRTVKVTCGVGLVIAAVLVVLVALVVVAPFTGARAFFTLAAGVGIADPVSGAEYLFKALPPVAVRTLILLATGVLLLYLSWAGRHEAARARVLLCVLAAAELVFTNAGVNPVMPASRLGPPAWTAAVAAHPETRFYFGGKFHGILAEQDVDLRGIPWRPPTGVTVEEGRTLLMSRVAMAPSGWGVRELISYDLPQLWPIDQARAGALFERADRPERFRFLARGGVGYCLLSSPPYAGATPLAPVGDQFVQMALYECVANARRAYVVPNAEVIADATAQLRRLFEESFDADSTVMLDRAAPEAAGSPGTPSPPAARITADADRDVAIDATAPDGGGYLVLLDSFDRDWRVDVDGRPGPLLRANGLYRAVRVTAGPHRVVFTHRPTTFYVCALLSGLTAIALAAAAARKRRTL